jgi:hypothetical protein
VTSVAYYVKSKDFLEIANVNLMLLTAT